MQSEMRAEGKEISITKLCRWFGVPRSSFYYEPETPGEPAIDEELVETIRGVIEAEPAFGLRRITAVVRRKLLRAVNRKRVHRVLKLNGWQIWRKPQGKRPRAQGWASRATRSNERWAVDATHIFCGRDGWCHLTAIIDCCDRAIVGWRLSKTGVAKVAAAALEEALRGRQIDAETNQLTLRSDNGLVFGAKPFVDVVRRYGLEQEYITPYTPEQNGMIERFFGSLKAECVWLHRFRDRDHAFDVISRWIDRYHDERPHQALGYLTPSEYRERLAA
ncbi:MAG TPA: IS3 family transposase [Candidatus Binatia bacterium]|nr:IS3 family transposase [Candidatus Binatia bacterium]